MHFSYVSGDCGSGKTNELFNNIINNPDLYIVAANKIQVLNEHCRWLESMPGSTRMQIHPIHSGMDEPGISVEGRIVRAIEAANAGGTSHCVIFITHEALNLVNWHRPSLEAHRWKLFIDEAPSPWVYLDYKFPVSHSHIAQYFTHQPLGGGELKKYSQVQLSPAGEALLHNKGDHLYQSLGGILNAVRAGKMAIANTSFFNPSTTTAYDNKILSVYAITDPDSFSAFGEATILAANFHQTFAYKIWSKVGVKFTHHRSIKITRTRRVPISQRVQIYYFSRKDASLSWFRGDANPLAVASKWVDENIDVPFYYTVNEGEKGGINLDQITSRRLGKKIPPIALGSNQEMDKSVAVWFASLKAKPLEYAAIQKVFGLSRDEFDRAREHEALYQFLSRSIIRNFDSDAVVKIYVISERQAKFLLSMTGAAHITQIGIELPLPTKVKNPDARPVGAPIKHLDPNDAIEAQRKSKRESARRRRLKIKQQQLAA